MHRSKILPSNPHASNWGARQKRHNTPKMFYAEKAHLPVIPWLSTPPASDILRSMSVSVRPLEHAHAQLRSAIIHRQPIAALYRGDRRLLCPHLLGWNRHRRLQVLCYQYGGDSESGLEPVGSPDNWRCLAVEHLARWSCSTTLGKRLKITRGLRHASKRSNSMWMTTLRQSRHLHQTSQKVQNSSLDEQRRRRADGRTRPAVASPPPAPCLFLPRL